MTLAIWGTEKVVRYTNVSVDKPVTTYLPTGGYVVGWRENAKQVKFKIFDGLGNTTDTIYSVDNSAGDQSNLKIQAVGTDGSFAVSWCVGKTLKLRVFGTNGIGGDIQTLTTSAGNDVAPMAAGPSGGFVSTYMEGAKIWFATHSANGAVEKLFQVNHDSPNTVASPEVTQISATKYIVSYSNGNKSDTYYRTIDLAAMVPAFSAQNDAGKGSLPEIVALKNPDGIPFQTGEFAIVKQVGSAISVKFSGVDQEVSVTTSGTNIGDFMSATALRGGRVAVVLAGEGPNSSDPKIVLRIVDRNNNMSELVLEAVKGREPTITELKDGRLSVAWVDPVVSPSNISHVIVDPRLTAVNVYGTDSNDIYVGSEYGVDRLNGYSGNDALYGGDGHDLLDGGVGEDTLYGGNGGDWAVYDLATAGVTADLAANTTALGRTRNTGDAMGDVYISIENLRGSDHRDVLIGNGADNELEGMDGNDDLFGSAGADIMRGGAGYDQVSYQRSTASILFDLTDADGSDNRGDAQGDQFESIEAYIGSASDDTMIGLVGADVFWGGNGNDMLKGESDNVEEGKGNADILNGQNGNDALEGGIGADKLDGGDGNDTLEGGAGADTLEGGSGFDYVSYAGSKEGVFVDLNNRVFMHGDAAGDQISILVKGIIGSEFRDALVAPRFGASSLIGNGGNDELLGGDESDTLEGGLGSDTLSGGGGVDFASYEKAGLVAGRGVFVSLNMADKAMFTGDAAGDQLDRIEGLIGSAHADTLIGDGNANILRGGAQNDTLNGAAGTDRLEGDVGNDALIGGAGMDTLQGGAGDDNLDGGDDADRLEAGDGNDVLTGGAGADTLDGGAGNDTYYVDASDTIIEGAGQGIDTVVVTTDFTLSPGAVIENIVLLATATVRLLGNELDNFLTGTAGTNILDGQAGNDLIVGGAGADAMTGGFGNDTIYVDDAGDVVVEHAGQGIDTVMVNTAAYVLGAGAEVETLRAGAGALNITGSDFANAIIGNGFNNQLWGKAGNDQIRGDVGHDRLYGGTGDDKLYGGVGNDQLKGEAGKDVFVFDTRTNKSTNVDKVLDFKSKDDSFHLDNAIFTKLGRGTAAGVRFKSDMFVEGKKAQDREDRIVYDKKTGALYYDKDGTGGSAQVKIATISNKTKLYYHDFFVI